MPKNNNPSDLHKDEDRHPIGPSADTIIPANTQPLADTIIPENPVTQGSGVTQAPVVRYMSMMRAIRESNDLLRSPDRCAALMGLNFLYFPTNREKVEIALSLTNYLSVINEIISTYNFTSEKQKTELQEFYSAIQDRFNQDKAEIDRVLKRCIPEEIKPEDLQSNEYTQEKDYLFGFLQERAMNAVELLETICQADYASPTPKVTPELLQKLFYKISPFVLPSFVDVNVDFDREDLERKRKIQEEKQQYQQTFGHVISSGVVETVSTDKATKDQQRIAREKRAEKYAFQATDKITISNSPQALFVGSSVSAIPGQDKPTSILIERDAKIQIKKEKLKEQQQNAIYVKNQGLIQAIRDAEQFKQSQSSSIEERSSSMTGREARGILLSPHRIEEKAFIQSQSAPEKKYKVQKRPFMLTKTPGFGDCFFIAYGKQTKLSAQEVRNIAADEIFNHPDRYENFLVDYECNVNEYAKGLRNNLWGGDVEIIALQNVNQRPVIVLTGTANLVSVKSAELLKTFEASKYPDVAKTQAMEITDLRISNLIYLEAQIENIKQKRSPAPIWLYYNGNDHYDELTFTGTEVGLVNIITSLVDFTKTYNHSENSEAGTPFAP